MRKIRLDEFERQKWELVEEEVEDLRLMLEGRN